MAFHSSSTEISTSKRTTLHDHLRGFGAQFHPQFPCMKRDWSHKQIRNNQTHSQKNWFSCFPIVNIMSHC